MNLNENELYQELIGKYNGAQVPLSLPEGDAAWFKQGLSKKQSAFTLKYH